jgi:hypothetical protein
MTTRVCGALLLAAAAAPAQNNPVVPASMATSEGGSSSNIPFGTNQAVRFQCIYDAEELPWTGPRVINAIALRADNTDPGTTTFAQKQYIVMTMLMSTTSVRAEDASTTFADNLGADATTVIANGRISLPAEPPMQGVRPCDIVLTLDQPWVYGGTPVRSGYPAPANLLIEIAIQLQPAGAYRLDNLGDCDAQATPFGNRGPLCRTSQNGAYLDIAADPSMLAGGSYGWTITGMPPSAAFSLMLNITSQGTIFGQPIPFAMFDPQNPGGPVPNTPFQYGAPDCWINVQLGRSVLGTADTAGIGRSLVTLPAGRQFVGMSLYAQAMVFDLSANPLLVVTSQGLRSTVCGPLGVARIYYVGSATASAGQKSLGQGAIFDVR